MGTGVDVSGETVLQSDASLIFVKLRKMIASDTQPTDTILGTIAVAAHSLTGATGAAIAMPRNGAVVCVGRSGETAPELGELLDIDSGISGECMRTGVIMRCDDASRDFHVDAEVCRQLGLQSIAVVPLRGQHGRVGVLEAFSTECFAFAEEEKMELLGRLAGLAEAAWARGAVTVAAPDLACAEPPTEAPPEELPALAASDRLDQVRDAFATVQLDQPQTQRQWRYAAIAAVVVLALVLLSSYGWRTWYKASIGSKANQAAATPPATGSESQEVAAGAGTTEDPEAVLPVSAPAPKEASTIAVKPAADVAIPDTVVRRRDLTSPPVPSNSTANTAAAPGPSGDEVPQIAASSSGASELGNVLSATPVLPSLGLPISKGVTGGVLVHKVQPIYPAEARRTGVEGSVVLDGVITVEGQIEDLKLVSGPPLLAQAAIEAVKQWRYTPYALSGKPLAKQTRITISFIAPR